ncbi:hypothetical protein [Parasporobacterium paucivorans]|uniref:Uncharacterized protein n=1 Tax=Parasporobacterium paucivorans DSM 15970 TaxID=1122934 RepID=A0A1M6EP20_9FIRM|nr:hypothetical protein [Parasporobacterium paucivorans]SHI87212.1 hypothetical protein SAMN02745691_00963 [Parasporobacterium paucivorans DSM 15970]
MPEVFPNNQLWHRGGVRLNIKPHLEMTEEEKAHVATCKGIKKEHICKNPIFRCSKCGNYGCVQEVAEKCTDQGFKNDICLQCGATGTFIPVMEDELERFKAEWEKNDI